MTEQEAKDAVAIAALSLAQARTGNVPGPGTRLLIQWATASPDGLIDYGQIEREVQFTPEVHGQDRDQ